MKDLHAIRGARLLREWIAQGEHQTQDFKFAISDARKIARSLSAFANHEGGRLLIGVKDNGVIAGVRNEEDIYVVEQAAERYCYPPQEVTFQAYRIDGPTHVIVASINAAEKLPVYAVEPDGCRRAYFRVADENIAAHPLMVRAWEQKYADNAPTFSLEGPAAAILDYIVSKKQVSDTRRMALDLHISADTADSYIARLAAIELLRFKYSAGHFVLEAAEE